MPVSVCGSSPACVSVGLLYPRLPMPLSRAPLCGCWEPIDRSLPSCPPVSREMHTPLHPLFFAYTSPPARVGRVCSGGTGVAGLPLLVPFLAVVTIVGGVGALLAAAVWVFSRGGRAWVQGVVQPVYDKVGREDPEVSRRASLFSSRRESGLACARPDHQRFLSAGGSSRKLSHQTLLFIAVVLKVSWLCVFGGGSATATEFFGETLFRFFCDGSGGFICRHATHIKRRCRSTIFLVVYRFCRCCIPSVRGPPQPVSRAPWYPPECGGSWPCRLWLIRSGAPPMLSR